MFVSFYEVPISSRLILIVMAAATTTCQIRWPSNSVLNLLRALCLSVKGISEMLALRFALRCWKSGGLDKAWLNWGSVKRAASCARFPCLVISSPV